jgi:cytochrome oxidase assembly protein ShyY1
MTDSAQKTNGFKWQPNAKLLVFSLLMLPLLLSLGSWQLQRGDEKKQIVDHHTRNQQLSPVVAAEELASGEDQQYRLAWIRAKVDNQRVIILDNKVKNGRPGYEILQSVTLSGEREKLLINRGWVEASLDRDILPSIAPIEGEVQLRGYLYRALKGGYRLDDGIRQVQDWPSRVGWITLERAEELFNESFMPYQLRLDQDSIGALKTGWATVAVQPEKHVGYAVQWFAMAITLLIMTIIANSNILSWLKQRKNKLPD